MRVSGSRGSAWGQGEWGGGVCARARVPLLPDVSLGGERRETKRSPFRKSQDSRAVAPARARVGGGYVRSWAPLAEGMTQHKASSDVTFCGFLEDPC